MRARERERKRKYYVSTSRTMIRSANENDDEFAYMTSKMRRERLRRMRSIDALVLQFTCTNTIAMYTDTWVIRRWPREMRTSLLWICVVLLSITAVSFFNPTLYVYVYTSIESKWINVYKRIYIVLHQYTQDVIMRLVLEKKRTKAKVRATKAFITHTFSCKWALVHFKFVLTRFERFFPLHLSLFHLYSRLDVSRDWSWKNVHDDDDNNEKDGYNPWDNVYFVTRLNFVKQRGVIHHHCTIKISFHATRL